MIDSNNLLKNADRRLEEYDFAGARQAFREGITACQSAPPAWALDNLMVAEELEQIEFRRALSAAHPDSLDVNMIEIKILIRYHFMCQALHRCNDLLQWPSLAPGDVVRIRFTRFGAAIKAPDHATFVADFLFLWKELGSIPRARRMRDSLTWKIGELTDTTFIAPLQELAGKLKDDIVIKDILEIKVEQLNLFKKFKENGLLLGC